MASLHKTAESSTLWNDGVWEVAQQGNYKSPQSLLASAAAAYKKYKNVDPESILSFSVFLEQCDEVIEHCTGKYLNLQSQANKATALLK